ncbi:hypothetical protein Hanom_Chr14g01279671 [Helianthus anomalus]
MSTGKGKGKVIDVGLDIQRVEHIIEQCRILNLNPKEVINGVYKKHKIKRFITDESMYFESSLIFWFPVLVILFLFICCILRPATKGLPKLFVLFFF